MGADYSFYVKTIETHARTFFKVIIFSIGSVVGLTWGKMVSQSRFFVQASSVAFSMSVEKHFENQN